MNTFLWTKKTQHNYFHDDVALREDFPLTPVSNSVHIECSARTLKDLFDRVCWFCQNCAAKQSLSKQFQKRTKIVLCSWANFNRNSNYNSISHDWTKLCPINISKISNRNELFIHRIWNHEVISTQFNWMAMLLHCDMFPSTVKKRNL